MALEARVRELVTIGDGLFSKKAGIDQLRQDIAEHFYPERADFTRVITWGEEFGSDLYSSYPPLARRELGNLFQSYLRPDSQAWFEGHVPDEKMDERHENRLYLEWLTTMMRRAMYDPLANFVASTKMCDHDWAAFGETILEIDVTLAMRLIFRACHPRDHAFTENYLGRVDNMHCKYDIQARDLLALFPKSADEKLRELARKEPARPVKVRRIVVPRDMYEMKGARRAQMVSLYIDCDNEKLLEEKGLLWNPYVVPRWQRISGCQYGFSPATLPSLPEARTLQAMSLTLLETAQKEADPPTYSRPGVLREDLALYAGGNTPIDEEYDEKLGPPIKRVFEPNGGVAYGLEMQAQIKAAIADGHFLNKLMLPPDIGKMTAYEVRKRLEEHIRQAMPILAPAEDEYSGGICERVFESMSAMGAFPEEIIPDDLKGADVRFTFSSPIREVEKEVTAQKFMEGVSVVSTVAEFDPAQLEQIDFTVGTRKALKGLGFTADMMKPLEAVEAARRQLAEKAKMEAGMAAVTNMAQVAETGSAAIKNLRQPQAA